jgi:hypothetical protein
MSLAEAERSIATLFRDRFGVRGWIDVTLRVHDSGGAQSFDGTYRRGILRREAPLRDPQTGNLVGFGDDEGGLDPVSEALFALHDASLAEPLGPWYHAELSLRADGSIAAKYWWEGTDVASIAEIVPDSLGLPTFPFKRRIRGSLLREWPRDQLIYAIETYVVHRVHAGDAVPDLHVDLYAVSDWLGDAGNGGHDQYFARVTDYLGAQLPRVELYARAHRMLGRLARPDWVALYEEAIATWSHFHPRLDAQREGLGIAARPRQDESDVDGRLHRVSTDIHAALCAYVAEHAGALQTTD